MKASSAVGITAYKTELGKAQTGPYTELLDFESISGGAIRTNSEPYTPAKTGIAQHYPLDQEYSDVTISVAKDIADGAFGDSLVTILRNAAKSKEQFDLVKMIPVGGGTYEVYAYSGFVDDATPNERSAKNLQKYTFNFKVSGIKEFTGTIADGVPTLTPVTNE